MNQEKIGKFILECRKKKNLTQSELAEKIGVTDKSISNWENGRNMPDLSLFKPLCEILDISVNDLISGENVSQDEYQKKLEENIISTIDYTNKKVLEKNNIIGIILITFGVLLVITAFSIFPSESSWGSIYSIFGGVISLIGVSKFTRKLKFQKRFLFNFGYFLLFVIMSLLIDYISVVNMKQAPRFSIYKITSDSSIYYDTLFYDVVRCNRDTKKEYYKVMKNQSYDIEEIEKYCK
jgi:hypothetical protein